MGSLQAFCCASRARGVSRAGRSPAVAATAVVATATTAIAAATTAAAQAADIDIDQMRRDMDSKDTTAIIARTRAAVAALGINGTPGLAIRSLCE